MKHEHDTLEGKTVAVAGFGNVAWGVVQKLSELGAKPLHFPVRMDTSTIRMESQQKRNSTTCLR